MAAAPARILRLTATLLVLSLLALIAADLWCLWIDWNGLRGLRAYMADMRGDWSRRMGRWPMEEHRWTIQVAAGGAASILLLAWYPFAAADLRRAGRAGLRHGPAMAFLWWLIPLANLFMPAVVMFELYAASRAGARGAARRRAPGAWALVLGWWALLLLAALVGAMAVVKLARERREGGALDFIAVKEWLIAADALAILANGLTILLVVAVTAGVTRACAAAARPA
jgi:hypothetical protein